ncbi:hypothetical protein J6TS7_36880 [Paenibacillus dendritiformis]|nr:hypothetical protein J6TS7_36880 [Paenibacillus dendritiformis]
MLYIFLRQDVEHLNQFLLILDHLFRHINNFLVTFNKYIYKHLLNSKDLLQNLNLTVKLNYSLY